MLQERFSLSSLSARVFWLIAGIILLAEMLAVMPGMAKERQTWLWERVSQARLAAMAITLGATPITPRLRDTVLRLSDTLAISLQTGGSTLALAPDRLPAAGAPIQLDHESPLTRIWRADRDLAGLAPPYARIEVRGPGADQRIQVVVSRRALTRDLRRYMARMVVSAVVLAAATGGLVFAALDPLLVRPMRIITASIAGFRRNPGYAALAGLKWLGERGDDEIALAARELASMQHELRADLWRNARLAALGTSVAKISHDLRNILNPALLVADRLQGHADPAVQQAANTLIPAMERAIELVSRAVAFVQEGPLPVSRSPVALHALVDEVAEMLRTIDASVTIDNQVRPSLVLPLDRTQIFRVLANLLRNAMEAGATRITLKLEGTDGTALVISDNGPGLPGSVVANLFRPFAGAGRNGGTGLGLAIARDLIRAHGGDLTLRNTGPQGTAFVMGLSSGIPDETINP